MTKFEELLGKTLSKIEVLKDNDDIIYFTTVEGEKYKMYHEQDCCESVYIENINGNLDDLLNTPLTMVEEATDNTPKKNGDYEDDSATWTFYRLATIKGYVTIRWYGSSNGYYSESVDFVKADKEGNF